MYSFQDHAPAARPHIRFRSVFPVGETDVRLPPPDVCRTRTPDRLAPGAAPCRVRVFPFPERIRPSALLTGCSAAILSDCPAVRLFAHLPRSTPRYDRQAPYSDRPNRNRALFGPIRPTAKRTAPSPNRIRPLRATARSVRCVSAVSRVILRSLPASEREGALRRIPPPHRGGRQPILTARPRNTGCTARPPIHGPRFTDLAGHRIRNTHPGTHEVRGGAVPCGSVDANRPTQEPAGIAPMHGPRCTRPDARTSRGTESGTRIPAHTKSGEGRPSRAKRRREPTDAGAGLRKPVAAKTARPAARTVRRKKPGEKSPSAQTPAANERPPAGATAANRRKGPV